MAEIRLLLIYFSPVLITGFVYSVFLTSNDSNTSPAMRIALPTWISTFGWTLLSAILWTTLPECHDDCDVLFYFFVLPATLCTGMLYLTSIAAIVWHIAHPERRPKKKRDQSRADT